MIQLKSGRDLLFVALAWAIGGCASTPSEPVGETTEAIGTECANAAPTMTFQGGIDVTSPQTYDQFHCFKAQVYDVASYDGNVGARTPPALSTLVQWADTRPAVSACTSAWVGSDLFESNGVGGWIYRGSQSANGVVVNGACFVPSILWTTEMPDFGTYRVTASARTFNGSSAATRKVLTRTLANGATDRCLQETISDGDPCTVDACDPATGAITNTPFPPSGSGGGGGTSSGSGGGCP